ncbi:alpha/beta hydrolase [Sphingomonas yabuuchiae]|uniref:alpha/beta hydrolase n=1 Tax=Sphingomonas yabuuchiae TaxID=172044 RepID=UPI0025FC109A|nr:alpha/beta hydrolase [uncultured Sphingomonas sp.]
MAPHLIRRSVTLLALVPLVLSLSACLGAPLIRKFIYLPSAVPPQPDWSGLPAPQPLVVRTDDGLEISGYRWPASQSPSSTLIFFHGNGGNRYTAALMAAPLRRPDTEIIIASYRGYSGNPGRPNETGLYRDGAAFLRYARAAKPTHLYLFGFSLGGGVALRLAADHPVDGVVTLGAFSTLASVAPPWAAPLLPDRFDNLAAVRRLHAPLLILHGSADDTIPLAEAAKLQAASATPSRVVILPDAQHHVSLGPFAPMIWHRIQAMTRRDQGAPSNPPQGR